MDAKKLLIDTDPGIDDAVALTMALFDSALEVVAVTAVAGNVQPEQSTRNVQTLVERLDPPRWPRMGSASDPDEGLPSLPRRFLGSDGLGNANFPVAELHQRHPAEKIIGDELRAAPERVTLLALGPLTNVARALQREPSLADLVGQLVMVGGVGNGVGTVTPAAEFNIYCDPRAARAVFRTSITKILVPIDITSQVVFTFDMLGQMPDEGSRAGRLLRAILPPFYRGHRQELGMEGIFLHDAVGLAAVLHPELFELQLVGADVELQGELTTGATVFDRRRTPEWRSNLHLAVGIDAPAVTDYILRALAAAGAASRD